MSALAIVMPESPPAQAVLKPQTDTSHLSVVALENIGFSIVP
jgi:hypothetical protein